MVKKQEVDIFKAPIDVLCHQANCMCTMGAGIAAEIRQRFPEAYKADCATKKGDLAKLGTFSSVYAEKKNRIDPERPLLVVNLYGQFRFGHLARYTNYEAVARALESLRETLLAGGKGLVVGIPHKMGCSLAGGDWNVVEAIIHSVFEECPLDALICTKPELDRQ